MRKENLLRKQEVDGLLRREAEIDRNTKPDEFMLLCTPT
jgi:hypothetical protein